MANIGRFKSCPIPDCTNIHPAPNCNGAVADSEVSGKADGNIEEGLTERVIYCGGCRTSICTVCEAEDHEGLTCAQYRMEKAPPNVLRNKIHEDILTQKCPRCKKAFLDFDGCFALKCSNCPCAFCGWCLADCGNDAHSHVKDCRHKLNKDTYFGTEQEFKTAMRKKMTAELQAYLIGLEPVQRDGVLKVCPSTPSNTPPYTTTTASILFSIHTN